MRSRESGNGSWLFFRESRRVCRVFEDAPFGESHGIRCVFATHPTGLPGFKPGAKSDQKNTLKINEPGVYLVRVETRQTNSDHEHFSTIDLVIEGGKP